MEGDDIYFDDDRTKQFYEGRGKFLWRFLILMWDTLLGEKLLLSNIKIIKKS
jgi:hypothetical protein